MMIESLLEEYLQSLRAAGYSVNTIAAYQRDIYQWIEYAKLHKVEPLTENKQDAAQFLMDLARKGRDSTSIARKNSAMKNFFKFLKRRNYIQHNVFALMKPPRRKERLPEYLAYEQFVELINLCDVNTFRGVRDRALLEFLYSTGCRAQELVDLNYEEVKGRKEILIRGKGDKYRVAYLLDSTLAALEAYYIKRAQVVIAGEGALFITSKGVRLSRRALYYFIRKYEGDFCEHTRLNVHLFRHTFATHLLDEGANLREVQALLGHEQLSSTQIYTHVSVNRLKSAYRNAHPHAKRS